MVISPSLIISSLNLGILTILLGSIFFFSKSYFSKGNVNFPLIKTTSACLSVNNDKEETIEYNSGPFAMAILKVLAFLSVLSLLVTCNNSIQSINITLSLWLSNTPLNISLNFIYDQYFLVFLSVALIVTWSIMEFSFYYMTEDPNSSAFFRLLTIFLLNMLILTCSNSLFLIFLGWEGGGFLSFLLISWWTTRNDASSSALEAVITNRIGNIGLITFMALSALNFNSSNLTNILSSNENLTPLLPFLLFGLILAAAGKSAQFGLHPWLPALLEGPTPVSALLHSSTMVVAGVFLLVRTSELFSSPLITHSLVLILGGTTALFAASTAIAQHDIKKIIAYSTTSQLGLMVTAIGIGQPALAFFHICTHAFFKAMLFLCSGSVIHSLSDEQDLRKMGGLSKLLPVTSSCLILGSLALMAPLLAGFYSKDLILEATSASVLNLLGIVLSIVATMLTAVYSFRIIFFCFSLSPSCSSPFSHSEENFNLNNALLRLATGTIASGWFFSNLLFAPPSFNVTSLAKGTPLIVPIIGVAALFMSLISSTSNSIGSNAHSATTSQWFFVDAVHLSIITMSLALSFFSSRTLDRGWQENIGPQGIAPTSTALSKISQAGQIGLIKRYILSSMASVLVILALSLLILS
ncbi:NADH dehydrogenase subunit 5 (mitochondrion) [Strongylocentrotus purpuratus]|uniref:NADH-ubiquinone oxidoreductase chain 5 n=1 Tax=Strongylocentrotus purpuratus TaxID=7668 RepID=NU5M_STRPU|nr:NADH dehydrogenase subunit 5 [Strongylocentrotus purpuratus]P15552.1 RecName: Full=NADH-ubiquinone oxidoreductase chain 5; AltName: Full=NADH dehydrogenase subunit 5 [Strongylocentrotus purpuratus]CAA31160.1 NADH dehydrogenase (ND5) subunit 5 [Strongylocentrotus purpuratus]|eukprot:NP_006975.1 NADH dehydrogenase subunit 5 (mitochondrion) [Strongylocentrotus purpuratus]